MSRSTFWRALHDDLPRPKSGLSVSAEVVPKTERDGEWNTGLGSNLERLLNHHDRSNFAAMSMSLVCIVGRWPTDLVAHTRDKSMLQPSLSRNSWFGLNPPGRERPFPRKTLRAHPCLSVLSRAAWIVVNAPRTAQSSIAPFPRSVTLRE